MAQMVENVIAHSRLEEGRARMQPRPIALGTLLEECRPDLERRAGVHPLTIETDAVKDIAVLADPAAVGQILVNLIENAAKYAPGPITLRAQVHHRTARLHVRDQGHPSGAMQRSRLPRRTSPLSTARPRLQSRAVSWLKVLVFVALIAAAYLLSRHRATPSMVPQGEVQVGADHELEFRAETVAIPGGRRFHLSSRNGVVDLVLLDAKGAGRFAFGDGRFEQRTAEPGAGFVSDVAAWLDKSTPPRKPGRLATFLFSYVRLGATDGWEANKLFLRFGAREAEVYLNVAPDGKRVRLLEKHQDYAADLLAVLAIAVRDGIPPRRSTSSDKHMASDEPLFARPTSLTAQGRLHDGVWSTTGFVGIIDNRRVVHWASPGAEPTTVGTSIGIVTALAPAPRSTRIAAVVVHPKRDGSYSSEDPTELVIFMPGNEPRTLLRSEVEFKLMSHASVVWSPDGTRLAVSAPGGKKVPRKSHVRVIDARSAEVLQSTEKALDLEPVLWSAKGLTLVRRDFVGADILESHYSWDPEHGVPKKLPALKGVSSPDGRFLVGAEGQGVLVVWGPDGSRRYASQSEEDRAVVSSLSEFPIVWCGPHHVVLGTDDPVVLDLNTLTVRLLFPARAWTLVAASPDGDNVLCLSPDGEAHWGSTKK